MTSPVKEMIATLEEDRGYSHWQQAYHRDMVTCWTIVLRNALEPQDEEWRQREHEYLALVEKYGATTIRVWSEVMGKLLLHAKTERRDYLGEITMGLGMGAKDRGQFFTPYSMSLLAAQMAFDKPSVLKAIETKGYVSINEPSCGSGGMIVAYAQTMLSAGLNIEDMRVVAQDIDRHCVNMTYVQMWIYDIPAVVIRGDTLKAEEHEVLITPAYMHQENQLQQRV